MRLAGAQVLQNFPFVVPRFSNALALWRTAHRQKVSSQESHPALKANMLNIFWNCKQWA